MTKESFIKKEFSCNPLPPSQFKFAIHFSKMKFSKVILLYAIIKMISAGPVPSQHTNDEPYVNSRNRIIYGNDCGPAGCATTESNDESTTQILLKERASIMKLHCLIDSLVNPDKYSGPPDLREIHNVNPLLVFIQC